MKVISKFTDGLCTVAKYFCAALLGIMLVVSLIEIVRRYIFGESFPWADELIRYCIVGIASIGGAAAYHLIGGLVSFDLLVSHTHGKGRVILEFVINSIVFGFSIFMLKNSIETIMTPSIQRQISIGLHVSMLWAYLPIVIGMAMLLLLSLEKYLTIIQSYRNGEYDKVKAGAEKGGEEK